MQPKTQTENLNSEHSHDRDLIITQSASKNRLRRRADIKVIPADFFNSLLSVYLTPHVVRVFKNVRTDVVVYF